MGFREVQEKANEIQQAVAESSILIGPKSGKRISGVAVPVGMGMDTYASNLEAEAERLKNSSMFKILFMGTFKNGKSTTVNALLGGDLLPTAATACTAVISQVVYGTHSDTVKVYHEGATTPQKLSLDKFYDEYKLTDEDYALIEEEGHCDRFQDVDCVVLESDLGIFKDGVQFIDSPGLGEAVARTKTTNKYIPQANAIVFLLDAIKLFSLDEKNFIRKHFALVDPKPRNVFFLVNRINLVNNQAGVDAVKQQTKNMLKAVFSDENGFNEELYNSRVFFVNSYGALEMRKRGQQPVGTQIPEFKAALEQFLTSEDRVIAKYKSVVANMAGVYSAVEKQAKENAVLLSKNVDELVANRGKAEKKLKDLQKDIDGMEHEIDRSKKNITDKVLNSLETFVKVDLVNDWPAYAEKYDDKFGITDMLLLALPMVSEERKQEILAPMVCFVNGYVEEKLEAWSEGIPVLIADDIATMQEELKDKSIGFDLKLDQAKAIFAGADASGWKGQGANKLQLALSLIQGDISVAVENSAGGNFSWGEFFKKYIVQAVINIMIASLVGGGIPGLLVFAVVEMVQMGLHAGSARNKLLNGFAEKLFPKIGNKLMDKAPTISADISNQFEQQKRAITKSAYGLIEDEKRHQNDIIAQAKMKREEIAAETERQKQIMNALYQRTNLIYKLLFNKNLDIADMDKLAAMVEAAKES